MVSFHQRHAVSVSALFERIYNTGENIMKIKWHPGPCPSAQRKSSSEKQAGEHLLIHVKQNQIFVSLVIQWNSLSIGIIA